MSTFAELRFPDLEGAACKGSLDDWMWHPLQSDAPRAVERARGMFCGTCPVALQCRAWAENNAECGVWAGKWYPERPGRLK